MSKSRYEILNRVFDKFLLEALKPLSVENLEPMLKDFPKEVAQELHDATYNSVEQNTREEFKKILAEKNIKERLDLLDQLYAKHKSSYELNMNAFDFEHHDPDVIKSKIVYNAKSQEKERLLHVLNQLKDNNDHLQTLNQEILEQLSKSKDQIKETQERLRQLVPS